MNKTSPIGVRFRLDVLESLKKNFSIDSPQKALVFLERFYVSNESRAKDITQVLRSKGQLPKVISDGETIPLPNNVDPIFGTMAAPDLAKREIERQIKAIKEEKCPEYRAKTTMGKKSWEMDQKKRIEELENQLKQLNEP